MIQPLIIENIVISGQKEQKILKLRELLNDKEDNVDKEA